jgi:hypothetical protein
MSNYPEWVAGGKYEKYDNIVVDQQNKEGILNVEIWQVFFNESRRDYPEGHECRYRTSDY